MKMSCVVTALMVLAVTAVTAQTAFVPGQIFLSLNGQGIVKVINPDGSPVMTLNVGPSVGGTTFDSQGNLWVTRPNFSKVLEFDKYGTFMRTFGGGYNLPESIVFDSAGNVYVSNASGIGIRVFDSQGTFQRTIAPPGLINGSNFFRADWMDLCADGRTLFFTLEGVGGTGIERLDLQTGSLLPSFARDTEQTFGVRLLPDGGLLATNNTLSGVVEVRRYDANGKYLRSYTGPGWGHCDSGNCLTGAVYDIDLAPDGKSFWVAANGSPDLYHFDLKTGNLISSFDFAGFGEIIFGISVYGSPAGTCVAVPGRMTGGGSVGTPRVTHGFELPCDVTQNPANLEVNWGGGNHFHLTSLTAAHCFDDPGITPDPPAAGFDTYIGSGVGLCNGLAATATWTFTDAGEPGNNDSATINIAGGCSLSVSGNLRNGNQQAHAH